MSVGAAIRITSAGEERVIRHAADFARQQDVPCFVISVLTDVSHVMTEEDRGVALHNLEVIASLRAAPVMQEGDDVAKALLSVARQFDVETLFLQSGTSRLLGRSIAEQLLYLDPPFDVVIVSSE